MHRRKKPSATSRGPASGTPSRDCSYLERFALHQTRPKSSTNFVAKQPETADWAPWLPDKSRQTVTTTDPKPLKQLPFDPKIERRLQLNEVWRIVAKSYLLDPGFFEGIQSLDLNDAQELEDAKEFVKNPSISVRKSLLNRTLQIKKNFDRYSKVEDGTSNALTYMWLRMATMVNQTVEKREATNPDDFRLLMRYRNHCEIVIALLFEILADCDSSPDGFLRKRYLKNIGSKSEGSPEGSGQKRKRAVEEETDGNVIGAGPRDEAADEAIEAVDGGPSILDARGEEAPGEVDGGPSILNDRGDETTIDRGLNVEQESMQAPQSKTLKRAATPRNKKTNHNGQKTSQEKPSTIKVGPVAPLPKESQELSKILDSDEHIPHQQPRAPTAVMFVPSQQRPTPPLTSMAPTAVQESDQATATGVKRTGQSKGKSNHDIEGRVKRDGSKPVPGLEGSAPNGVAAGEDATAEDLRSMTSQERERRELAERRIKELEQKLLEASSKSSNDQTE